MTKTFEMSSSGDMHPNVFKKIIQFTKPSAIRNLVNKLTYFILRKISIYSFIYLEKRGDKKKYR